MSLSCIIKCLLSMSSSAHASDKEKFNSESMSRSTGTKETNHRESCFCDTKCHCVSVC